MFTATGDEIYTVNYKIHKYNCTVMVSLVPAGGGGEGEEEEEEEEEEEGEAFGHLAIWRLSGLV